MSFGRLYLIDLLMLVFGSCSIIAWSRLSAIIKAG
jgi:hypothetical protein